MKAKSFISLPLCFLAMCPAFGQVELKDEVVFLLKPQPMVALVLDAAPAEGAAWKLELKPLTLAMEFRGPPDKANWSARKRLSPVQSLTVAVSGIWGRVDSSADSVVRFRRLDAMRAENKIDDYPSYQAQQESAVGARVAIASLNYSLYFASLDPGRADFAERIRGKVLLREKPKPAVVIVEKLESVVSANSFDAEVNLIVRPIYRLAAPKSTGYNKKYALASECLTGKGKPEKMSARWSELLFFPPTGVHSALKIGDIYTDIPPATLNLTRKQYESKMFPKCANQAGPVKPFELAPEVPVDPKKARPAWSWKIAVGSREDMCSFTLSACTKTGCIFELGDHDAQKNYEGVFRFDGGRHSGTVTFKALPDCRILLKEDGERAQARREGDCPGLKDNKCAPGEKFADRNLRFKNTVHTPPSFSCEGELSNVENTICAEELGKYDQEMNARFKELLVAAGPEAHEAKKRQKAWLERRERECDGGTNWLCLQKGMEARTRTIVKWKETCKTGCLISELFP